MKHTYSCIEFPAWLRLLNYLFSQIALVCAIIFFENGIQLMLFHLTGLMLSKAKVVLLRALVPSQWHVPGRLLHRTVVLSQCQVCPGAPAPYCAWHWETQKWTSPKLVAHNSSCGIKIFWMGRRGFLTSKLQGHEHKKVKWQTLI